MVSIDTTDISFHGVRSIGQSRSFEQKELIQGFQPGFHCVILDLKDLHLSSVSRNSDLQ